MVRYVALLRRRPGTSREEFLQSWLGHHRSLAGQLPGLVRLEFMPTLDDDATDGTFDGMGYLDFPDRRTMDAALASQQAKALRAHTQTFADSGSAVRLVVQVPPRGAGFRDSQTTNGS